MKINKWGLLVYAIAIGIQAASAGLGDAYPVLKPIFTALATVIATVQMLLGPAIQKAIAEIELPKAVNE